MKVRLAPGLVRVLAPAVIDPLALSWRYQVRHGAHWERLVESGRPFIFLLWHEALLPLLWHHRRQRIAIMVSQAIEGRYLADYAARVGYRLLPGSSTRGGTRALRGAIRALQSGCSVAITPDGPRGPRRQVKPGVVRAAQCAGAWILPLHARADSAWRMGSWDRMLVPRPFANVEIQYGEPFLVGEGAEGLDAGVSRCTASLNALAHEQMA